MKVGSYQVSTINFGFFRLDGGAMFGSVPKNLWAKLTPADEENCIKLASRSLLIKGHGKTILVDVGLGDKWNEKSRKIFAINNTPTSEWGFNREDVTDVILTHLHFDHAGGITSYKNSSSQEVEISFPNATIYVQEENWVNANSPSLREKASYFPENVLPLNEAKLIKNIGDLEILPGIIVHKCNGHTLGQQWVEIKGKQSLMFATDLIPTSHHLPLPFTMGYDIHAAKVMEEKEAFLSYALKNNHIVVFQHDPEIVGCTVKKNEKGHYCVDEVVKF